MEDTKKIVDESSKYFHSSYQEMIFYQFYARWRDDLGRRETWVEAIDRYMAYMKGKVGDALKESEYAEIREALLNQEICPSMRLLWSAGDACDATNVTSYNCSYVAPTTWKDLSEIMYVSMCGAGCGFAVEQENVSKFPVIKEQTGEKLPDIIVDDSRDGWCEAFLLAATAWADGKDVEIDYSMIRPAGARLMTMGGRASGPQPLIDLMDFTRDKMFNAQGRQLTALELHDIICQIGLIVVAGGVRRCLPEGSLVHTKDGLIPIENVSIGDSVLTSDGYHDVTNKFDQGVQKLVRITTQDSYFECTPNHKIAVLNGIDEYIWKPANELMAGDRLIAPSVGVGESVATMPLYHYNKPKHSTTSKNITIPELDESMAWLIGAVQGDGYVGEKTVTLPVHNSMRSMGDRVKEQLERFGVSVNIKKEYENYYVLEAKSNQLAEYFGKWLKQANIELRIPDCINLSTPDIKLAYISGLMDADGSVRTRPAQVVVTVYEDFAKNIQRLLSSCGVQSRFKKLSTANLKDNWREKYSVILVNKKSKEAINNSVGFKKTIVSRFKEQNTNSYPGTFIKKWPNKINKSWSDTNGNLIPVSVVSVDNVDEESRTYDIEVETANEFFCNGYLMHNSALISLSELHDKELRDAKSGEFWNENGQRSMANNSAVYAEKPSVEEFGEEWAALVASGTGERGIFNRGSLENQVPARRWEKLKNQNQVGVNPCGEIYLRSKQFCNLTSIVVRPDDDMESLKRKMRLATILGTYQATLTDFGYLSEDWKKNCEEEQLLGVSITGYFDNPLIRNDDTLDELREESIKANEEYSSRFGSNKSTAITCVKPHGNSGQLLYVGSGMHPWFAKHYIRRVRISVNDPLMKMVQDQGIPVLPEVGYSTSTASTMVMEFPIKAPEGALTNKDVTALDMLKEWKRLKKHFTEHNPSVTIYAGNEEWDDIKDFVYNNWDDVGGLSFLPRSEHVYQLAPYEEITEEEYNTRKAAFKDIDFSRLSEYEKTDQTVGAKELACAGPDGCEVK